jgi:hypothetical protein
MGSERDWPRASTMRASDGVISGRSVTSASDLSLNEYICRRRG